MADQLAAWAQDQPPVDSDVSREMTVDFLRNSISARTVESYSTARKGYEAMGLSFPISSTQLCFYIRGMTDVSTVAGSTLRKYVSGLKTLNEILGYPALSSEEWAVVQRALAAADNMIGPRTIKQATPIPEDVSRFLFNTAPRYSGKLAVARDAVLTGISLGLRPGELLNIRGRDVHCAAGTIDHLIVTINLGITKTRRLERVETACRCPKEVCAKSSKWCAAHRLQELQCSVIPAMRIFHKVLKDFATSVRQLVDVFPANISQLSRDEFLEFTGHSCRRSSATYQIRSQIPRSQIKQNCRWRSDTMVDVYTSEELQLSSRDAAHTVRDYICSDTPSQPRI